jgi:hypothetical protein
MDDDALKRVGNCVQMNIIFVYIMRLYQGQIMVTI